MSQPLLSDLPAHKHLESLTKVTSGTSLRDLCKDKERNNALFIETPNLGILDMTRQKITVEVLQALLDLAKERSVTDKIAAMFNGEKINTTEDRAVLHVALRADAKTSIKVDGQDVVPLVHEVLQRIKTFSDSIRSGKLLGYTGKPLKNVVCIGIGGSYLGPEFVFEALRTESSAAEAASGRQLHFLANVDPIDVSRALQGFNADETLVVIISKTFTTAETMLNARTIRNWIIKELKAEDAVGKHVVAVSTNIPLTTKFGIAPENVFGFWDWVGGRYSVTSAVGVLPLALQYGFDIVDQFLSGARAMDNHVRSTPMEKNLAIMSALVAHYNSIHLGHNTVAILPYCQALLRFAAHIQQLNMESNGKGVTINGTKLNHPSGPVMFGEPGTNGQHSFYQLMHQGQVVPAEFIGFAKSQNPINLQGEPVSNHDELMSNFFAQPDALAFGKTEAEVKAQGVPQSLVSHKVFSGERPSTVYLLPSAVSFNCGILLSLYEHRTAIEGFLLGINSFDQWGVELGKVLATTIRSYLAAERSGDDAGAKNIKLPEPTQRLLDAYIKESNAK
eukprot:CAMPEP_0113845190 /NCGR_PEP_ID=MMETSP0372-20130328/623_1 /TAXON_ID=340204 /ORGANISM="Lankesteria abbotti" /LENGTH=561 /DNA_ID=CAMNT_0000814213 /DNA_START=148 /DNA_END=1833 /DNA_ORIENTATION=- /assembly_acc=CAM_ASM_000359